ncbi:MAG: hypothetical protein KAI24_03655 [Planctomycetes bacterium]|nr:hypothetical protein [Planctomycetota bacterium]
MVGILIKVTIGLVLFVASLVGGLAATGRLNHEGTANIPVLGGFFPEPPPVEGEEGEAGADGEDAHGHTDGAHSGDDGHAADATHGGGEHAGPADAAQGQDPPKPSRRMTGRSVTNPEEPKSDGHGGGHGDDGHGDDGHGGGGHGDDGHGGASHGADAHGAAPHGETAHGKDGHGKQDGHETEAERDFHKLEAAQGRTGYAPGAYFQFGGMQSGLTPEQINESWRRVKGILETIEQRKTALDLREKNLQELAEDISRRWKELGDEQLELEKMQQALDAKIARFEQTVRLVKNDEVQKLKRNAETMAAFERSKAGELIQQQWASERGQDEVLRLLEFMDKDAVNEILAELPNPMVQDILEKRMQISREAKASGK